MTDHEPVAVLGAGALGGAVATALAAAGHPTTVWNRTPARLAALTSAGPALLTAAPTVAEAVAEARVVIVVVADEAAVRAVLSPVAPALDGRVVVNLTSATPDQTRALGSWLTTHGARYLDAAAMSGTRTIGSADSLFLYAGDGAAFAAAEPVLHDLGRATHVGTDPGAASLWDTALLGLNLGLLTGFYHAVALLGHLDVDAAAVARVARDYLPFATGLLPEHARQADERRYPADDGSLAAYAAAVEHIVATSVAHGVATDVPDAYRALVHRGMGAGHGADGLASLAGVIADGTGGAQR
jgi:3-hydroxyisobutyrate dehydrogenase-like beta-hydroxyacid dehydrogenase